MKVRITHSIDLEEVPKKVSEMLAPATRDIGNVVRWLENVQQDLESDSITPEMTVSLIERVRLVLGDADTALQEANNIMQGVVEYNKQKNEPAPAPAPAEVQRQYAQPVVRELEEAMREQQEVSNVDGLA